MLEDIFHASIAILQWKPLLSMSVGVVIGILVGAVPGLTATMGVALVIPFTFTMEPLAALGLLAGIHNGASYGGAIPAILLRIPGTPGAITTAWDGYPMAQKGMAGDALHISAVSSAVGGMISALALITLAPPLANFALAFGPPEIFWVNMFGLASIAVLLGDDVLRGIMAACFGLLLGTVGLDGVTGHERFTFGALPLISGIPLLIVMVGMYSLPPAWEMAERAIKTGVSKEDLAFRAAQKLVDLWRLTVIWCRSSFIGIIIGILPGAAGIGQFIAYNETRRASPDPDSFGKGNPEGVATAESVNNADNAAAMIPALTLGIPGSAIAALMLGALLIHGFQPGSDLFRNAPDIVYGYTLQMFLTSAVLLFVGGQLATRLFAQILRMPQVLLMPMIVCMTVAGAFVYQNSYFDVYEMLIFGFIGLAMERLRFPMACVIVGLVLGTKAEFNLRISLKLSQGDWSIFYQSTISQITIALTVLVIAFPLIRYVRDSRKGGATQGAREGGT